MSFPLVIIIIAVKSGDRYLRSAIDSVGRTTHEPVRLSLLMANPKMTASSQLAKHQSSDEVRQVAVFRPTRPNLESIRLRVCFNGNHGKSANN
jgi:hypothetical protein